MPGLLEFGLGILLPALLCGIALAALEARVTRTAPARGVVSGLAFGLPWLLSFTAFFRRLPSLPLEGTTPTASDWLAWIVLLAALSSFLYLTPLSPRFFSGIVRVLFSAGLVLFTLGRWADRTNSWATIAVSIPLVLAVWSTVDIWIGRAQGPRAPLALLVAATAASLANLLARSALLGALTGAVAACLAAAFVIAILRPGFRLHPAASAVVVLVLAGALIQGHVFSKLPLASGLLVAGSLLAPGVADRIHATSGNPWKRTWTAFALALVPGALAVWIAWTPSEDLYGMP